jgi:uncharacterized DUF497 family protein
VTKGLHFSWDQRKSLTNKAKHGITFEEESQVFGDKLAITISDPDHGSDDEIREMTIGSTGKMRIVVVSHVSHVGIIRIISARKASSSEVRQYNEG